MAVFPGAVATTSDLLVAKNSVATRLAAAITSSATTLTFVAATATRLASYMAVRIDDEIIKLGVVSGSTATGCTRGYDNSTAAAHEGGRPAIGNVMAANVGSLSAEIIGIETALGANLANITSVAGTGVRASAYNWSLPGPVALVAGVQVVIPLSTFPAGITAAWVGGSAHHVLIRDAIGGYESLVVQAVSVGVSITVTPVSSHSAVNYTIGSANGGIQEAIYASSANAIYINDGATILYRLVTCGQRRLTFVGSGHNASYLRLAYPTQGGFYSNAYGYSFRNLCIRAYEAWSGTATHASGGVLTWASGDTWLPEVLGRNFTFNGVSVICTAYNSTTNITVAPLPAVVVGAAWAAVAQSSGKAAELAGVSVYGNGDGDLEAVGCEFYALYDTLYGNWIGGFIRAINNIFRYIGRYAIFGSAPAGGWALQICDNYMDGRLSTGLIRIEGVMAGGVISGNWMQASLVHIAVDATAFVCNELVIAANMFDQDTAATGCVIITGTPAAGSNCVKVADNYMRTDGYAVLAQDCAGITVNNNQILNLGAFSAITIGGSASVTNIEISGNRIRILNGAAYAIQLSNPSMTGVYVRGNSANCEVGSPAAMIAVAGAVAALFVEGNLCGQAIPKLLNNVSATGSGTAIVRGNQSYTLPSQSVSAAATITLPLADEAELIAVSATGTAITTMNGVSARAGCQRIFIVDGAVTWSTSSVADNKIGRAYGPTVAGQVVRFTKFLDNMWYPM